MALQIGRQRSLASVGGRTGVRNLHSLPAYYGFYTALWAGLPALFVAALWMFFEGSVITAMAQALGETAPLLMIGMVAFIVDIPGGPLDPATVLPVQVYLLADSPERAFVERTSAAIMVLLAFLIAMNTFAVIMRRRFERRW